MTGPCNCRHCTSPAAVNPAPVQPDRVELPAEPTPIRVHTADAPPFDCTLHPDGTQTAIINGQHLRNMLTLADMLEMKWAGARIEFNPEPLPEEHAPEPLTAPEQDQLAL